MAITKATYAMIEGAPVNVLDYGADPTGVANSTAAIQAALATGRAVYFPEGNYLSGAQTITNSGQMIYGDGPKSIITATSASANLFTVQANYVAFSDLRLNGISTNNTTTNFAIFTAQANPASSMLVQRLLITGASSTVGFNNAIKFDGSCNFNTVIDCEFSRLWGDISGTGYGILNAGNGSYFAYNRYIGSSGRGRHGVYNTAGASYNLTFGNYISASSHEGITQFSQGVQPTCARNIYSNNMVENCVSSGNATSGAIGIYGHSQDALLIGNEITNSGAIGIAVDGTSVTDLTRTVIDSNIVNYSATFGIQVISGVSGKISNNKVFESSTASVGTSPNINLRSDGTTATSDFIINGNHSAGPTYTNCAFSLDPTSPTPTNLTVYANKFNICQTGLNIQLNGVTCALDGRIQFRQDTVSFGPIANNSFVSSAYTVNGANTGDLCTVSHTATQVGVTLYATVNGTNSVVVTAVNNTGSSATVSSGTLRIDVWSRIYSAT